MENITPYVIYCDGSCKGQYSSRIAAWAYCILKDGNMIKYDSGRLICDNPTNQKAELYACIQAIKAVLAFSKDGNYIVNSDSAYLINCYQDSWYRGWEAHNWTTAGNTPVRNIEYWQKIIPYFKNKRWYFQKVKGHAHDYYNNFVDKLAQDACAIKVLEDK